MSRRVELEARRRALLARCEQQRAELTRQLTQLRSAGLLGLLSPGASPARAGSSAAHHPLAWVLAIGAIVLLGRTREALKLLVWVRTVLALASRAAQVVRLVASLRAARPQPEAEPRIRSVS